MHTKPRSGFTLVEIIVATGILLTLAVLAIPTASHLRRLQHNTICVSNLRQIGLGIQTYAVEHDGWLPGPLLSGQYPFSDNLPFGHYCQLAYVLRDYLEIPPLEQKTKGSLFICPAFKRVMKRYDVAVSYGVNIQSQMDGETALRPIFGYANNLDWRTFRSVDNILPLRLTDLGRLTDVNGAPAASSTWLLRDADVGDGRFEGLKPVQGSAALAKEPVHGKHRNALFSDFHVAGMPLP